MVPSNGEALNKTIKNYSQRGTDHRFLFTYNRVYSPSCNILRRINNNSNVLNKQNYLICSDNIVIFLSVFDLQT